MTVGEELRQARERAGLSIEDISQRIRIQMYKIDAFENGDFVHLPDGVYLDGFVRAYAREMGIDAGPLVERTRRERQEFAGQRVTTLDGFESESREEPRELAAFHSEPPAREPVVPRATLPEKPVVIRERVDLDEPLIIQEPVVVRHRGRVQRPPQPIYPARHAAQALGVVAVLAAAGWGGYVGGSLYHARRYHSANAAADRRTALSGQGPADATPDTRPADVTPEPRAVEITPEAREVDVAVQSRAADVAPDPAAANLSGAWRLATHVESARYSRFNDLRLGYELQLKQAGERVTGVGRKVTENGRTLRASARTPITVAGTVEGDQLTLNFTERGARRSSQGQFALMLDDPATLRGRFASDAGESSGTVEARRLDR